MLKKVFARSVFTSAAILFTGCGGGGGGGGPAPTPQPSTGTTDPIVVIPESNLIAGVDYTDPSQFMQTTVIPDHLAAVNAQVAFNNGFTGGKLSDTTSYVTVDSDLSNRDLQTVIAVLDSGILSSHNEFASVGKVESFKDFTIANSATAYDNFGHGTLVSSIVSANRDNQNDPVYGMAFDSKLLVGQVVEAGGGIWNYDLQEAIDWVNTSSTSINIPNIQKLAAINLSLGTTTQGFTTPQLEASFLTSLSKDISVVVAAGNEGLSCLPDAGGSLNGRCSFPAATPWVSVNKDSYLNSNGGWIVVGSVDSSNTISTFSNRAGVTKDNYLVAPGENIIGAGSSYNNDYVAGSGTSFAAPIVSGAMGLMAQKWPHLNGRQHAEVLFTTATDLGAPGTDDIYGRGLLNLTDAFSPVGTISVPLSVANVNIPSGGSSTPFSGTKMSTSSTMAALKYFEPINNTIVIDSFSRDFKVTLTDTIQNNGLSANDFDHYLTMSVGSVLFGFNESRDIPMIGYSFDKDSRVKVSYDSGTLFGSVGEGALSFNGASTTYVNYEKDIYPSDLFKISLVGSYGYGEASAGENSLISNVSDVHSFGGSIKASYNGLGVGYKIPLRVVSGSMTFKTPTDIDDTGNVVYSTEKADLIPNSFEQTYSVFYKKNLNNFSIFAELAQTRDAFGIDGVLNNEAKLSMSYFY